MKMFCKICAVPHGSDWTCMASEKMKPIDS